MLIERADSVPPDAFAGLPCGVWTTFHGTRSRQSWLLDDRVGCVITMPQNLLEAWGQVCMERLERLRVGGWPWKMPSRGPRTRMLMGAVMTGLMTMPEADRNLLSGLALERGSAEAAWNVFVVMLAANRQRRRDAATL